MTRKGFVTGIARERAPAVKPRQIVVAGIPPFRETGPAITLLRAPGAMTLCPLVPCSPDLTGC